MRTFYFLIFLNFILIYSSKISKNRNNNLKTFSKKLVRKLAGSKPTIISFYYYWTNTQEIHFLTKIKYNNEFDIPDPNEINLPITVYYKNRENTTHSIKCKNNTEHVNNFVIYNCTGNASSNNISKIEYNHNDTEYELSTLAASTKNDIRNGNTKFFNSTNTTIIENAEIMKITLSKLIIKGDSCISESNNIKLVLPYNGNIKELSCKGYNSTNKKDEEFFYLECNNNGIKTNINNVYGYYVNQYSDFIINFANPNSTDINYEEYIPNRKKKSGMSTGGIIAIIIPLVIVLLGVVALIMAIKMRTPTPPLKEIAGNNNTVGVAGMASSETVVNK